MTAETLRRAVLDWRDLAPEPEWHECDCRFCDMGGDQEPIRWPLLVTAQAGGVEYVTDRYLMVRADRAPVPADYESLIPTPANATDLVDSLADVSDFRPAPDQHFRQSTLKALSLTGWDLRLIRGSEKRVAVVDEEGDPIGVTITATHVCEDESSADLTRPYADHIESFRPESGDR